MVFASITFLFIFLPANLLLYYLLRRPQHRNQVLILFSFAFYAWGEPIWVSLLFLSASVDYVHGRLVERYRGTAKARLPVISSVVVNLGLLAAFKYSGFLYETINDVFGTSLVSPNFTLPIGISFYTFQTISYVVDVYRGEVRAQRSYAKFLMFVSLYHQLVAGPIVRYATIAAEVDDRKESLPDVVRGIHRFCVGLFKKVCIANVAGELVIRYMNADPSTLTMGESWFGLLMFSLQIYYDFSGYSDMAIGLGQMFGFHYLENFRHPYIARTATEFWRRWHISLGTFFRDYVYIPLGGNRHRPYRNLFVVWGLTGLWHGASWNFVLWGLYFGALILVERVALRALLDRLPRVVGHSYLLLAAYFGWALFYFTDMNALGAYLGVMFGSTSQLQSAGELSVAIGEHAIWLVIALVGCVPVYDWLRTRLHALASTSTIRWRTVAVGTMVTNLGMLLLATSMLVGRSYNPFLYFRF
ncbi:MAG: MBOAT family O-acyltransferase [Myxococcota bacterium]|nr:MBOAT family O-acyltransferase [Myxococcota bacterium]